MVKWLLWGYHVKLGAMFGGTSTAGRGSASSPGEERMNNSLWSLLPTFDPASDDAREYSQKVRFLHGICPERDRGMLAPRLAMLCRGTAWNQVQQIPPSDLTDPTDGVKKLLTALSSWEESEEMVTFEKFERALYKIVQKSDESTVSFVNRMNVAFDDLGSTVTIKDFKAFVLLRQSALGVEDKKRVLAMSGGKMDATLIDQSMRSLATKILTGPNETKKKVYPVNYVETNSEPQEVENTYFSNSYAIDDEEADQEYIEAMAHQGDSDALAVQTFEQDLEDLFQSTPDLQTALISYQEARQKLTDRRRYRGFWPTGKGGNNQKGKNKKGNSKGFNKASLLERIARTRCKNCGEKGHWRAECPNPRRDDDKKEHANVSTVLSASASESLNQPHVIIEEMSPEESYDQYCECLFVDHGSNTHVTQGNRLKNHHEHSVNFLTRRRESRRPLQKTEHPPCAVTHSVQELPQNAFVTVAEPGYAVLDTGASRSVIGQDLLPSLVKDLPATARDQMREQPSRIGFRFGNNQVLYSQKQIQIPLVGNNKKIWLLIEVVPGATPFLMSIHAMKGLGAQIDLAKNQCYLDALKKSLKIHESQTGLFTIRLSDLCHMKKCHQTHAYQSTIFASQHFGDSSDNKPSSCNSTLNHAEPSRVDRHSESNFRASCGKSQDVADAPHELDRDPCHSAASSGGTINSVESSVPGSSSAEDSHRGNQHHSSSSVFHSRKPTQDDQPWGGIDRLGARMDTVSVAPTVRSQAPTRRAPSVVSAAPTTPVPQPARNAPPATSQAASSVRALPPNLQLVEVATTTTRLDAWGEKEVTWGRKHKGSQYQHAFLDQSYVKWVAERENTLTPEMLDFHRYCQTRLHVAANI